MAAKSTSTGHQRVKTSRGLGTPDIAKANKTCPTGLGMEADPADERREGADSGVQPPKT